MTLPIGFRPAPGMEGGPVRVEGRRFPPPKPVVKCVGDADEQHHQMCNGIATLLAKQEDCPPDCEHPMTRVCFDALNGQYAQLPPHQRIIFTARPLT